MYGQQQQQPVQQLAGVPFNMVDQTTFNPNLPMNNDAPIQVQPSQWLNQQGAQQMLAMAVGLFRQRLQERAARTPLHAWAYNRISANRFQNPAWQQWCSHIFNFLEFISVAQAQNNPPQQAPGKAADTMFKCYLAQCVAEQPQLMSFIQDQTMVAEIQKYSQLLGAIMQDVTAYRSGAMMTPQMQQQQMFQQPQQQYQQVQYAQPQYAQSGAGQLPQIQPQQQYNQYPQQCAPMPLQAMGVGQHVQTNAPLPLSTPQTSGGSATGMDYGGASVAPTPAPVQQPVAAANPPAVMQPAESYGVSLAPISQTPINPAPIQTIEAMQVEELDRPIPISVKDVILDPDYYIPQGVEIDPERPFDTIYAPGGVITKPAYQTDWTVTRNDEFVYTQMVDPQRFIRFYTKWPDGMVQESIVEYTPMMDYLKHEINEDLRRQAHRPNGEVKLTVLEVSKTIADMKPIAEVKELQLTDENQPVRLPVDFQGSTDMENEVEARKLLRSELGLAADAKLPAHEYMSSRTHLVELDDATFEEILGLLEHDDLQQLAKDFSLMSRQGKIGQRTFNFIDGRLTAEVNSYLRDVLSQDVSIDSFFDDVDELFDHMSTELGEQYVKLLKDGAKHILARAVKFNRIVDGDDITHSIDDAYTNLQVGWELAELTDSKIDEEARLVSKYTHMALIEAIKGMLGRATPAERVLRRFRVITADGAYLEIFRGMLVKDAFMFKRVA